ncbi:MAG: CoA pyrophosphatase [Burkholderiales bacterium]
MRKNEGGLIAAAVLIPLVNHADGITVMLTVRPDHLVYHPGQISFPGGRAEAEESAIQTALREAREEIGLREEQVEILGTLADYTTLTGYRITPVVGLVDPEFAPAPDPVEVAEVFEVPLTHFLDANNHQRHRAVYEGRERQYYAMPFETRFIWGATAGMLYDFYRALGTTEEETNQC